jgi:hypothetical protein
MKKLEMIFPFDENEYMNEGIHIESDQFILDQQEVWEEEFHTKFKPFCANVIEGHPKAMLRLTNYIYGENPALKENILVFKYDPDDDDSEEEPIEGVPVGEREEGMS